MKQSLCGADCTSCQFQKNCKGCVETNGCPFGRPCIVAKYIQVGGMENYLAFKQTLLKELNELHIPGMKEIKELYPLVGSSINMEYRLPSGKKVKLLEDKDIYLGNQVDCEFDDSRKSCFGVVASTDFLLVSQYGEEGKEAEVVAYRRR